jgi:phosphoacetylglucosamine mutase
MDVNAWHEIYTDLPSKQTKIAVARKDHIICSDDEMVVVSPVELQEELNAAMLSVGSMSRCFVRPSGTENVVRVYAEAPSKEGADRLATLAEGIVLKYVN